MCSYKNTQETLLHIKMSLKFTEKRLQTAEKNYSHDTNNKLLIETKRVFKYIKENGLYDAESQTIKADEYLLKTLQIQADMKIEFDKYPLLTYFNIQRYIVNTLSNG